MTRTKKQPSGPTLCFVLLDKSGSMEKFKDATVEGLNAYIEQLKHNAMGKTFLTLMQFDTQSFDYTIRDHVISLILPLEPHQYQPFGGTPLYDAIAEGVAHMDWLSGCYPNSKVYFAIQTDGYENASTKFDRAKIYEMIAERTRRGWGFVFLGANQDAWANASQLGLQRGQTISYMVGESGPEMFRAVAANSAAYAMNGVGAVMDFAGAVILAAPKSILKDSRDDPNSDPVSPVNIAMANALPYVPDPSVDDFLKGLPDGQSKKKSARRTIRK